MDVPRSCLMSAIPGGSLPPLPSWDDCIGSVQRSWNNLFCRVRYGRIGQHFRDYITIYNPLQDSDTGGFSDRTGNMPDIFHTLFGLGALSLLGRYDHLKKINPTFCMPQYILDRLNILPQHVEA